MLKQFIILLNLFSSYSLRITLHPLESKIAYIDGIKNLQDSLIKRVNQIQIQKGQVSSSSPQQATGVTFRERDYSALRLALD